MKYFRTWWSKVILVVGIVVIAIQFVPFGVDNPATHDEPKWDSPTTRQLFMTACGDCHSNETKILWFEHVAPVKWYVADHVEEGRGALNVSEWHTNAGRDARNMVRVIKNGSMPPDFYTYLGLHSDSKLTAAQKQQLIDGIDATLAADPPTRGR
jgi:hypothetical protein